MLLHLFAEFTVRVTMLILSIVSHIWQSFGPSKYFVISEFQTVCRTQFTGIFLM